MGLSTRWSIARKQRNRIRQAYEIAQSQLGLQQQDIRQGTTEALNARGVLNGGSGGTAPAGSDRFVGEGMLGETGAANTLGGQAERDLSQQFTLERRDLWQQRQDAIAQNKAMTKQGAVDAGMRAAGTIAGAYFGGVPGAMLGNTIGGQVSPQMQTVISQRSNGTGQGPITSDQIQGPIAPGGIRGAFGLNPVDGSGTPEIGVASPGTDTYNFHI